MEEHSMKLLSCRQLTLGYGHRIVAENISFDINSGDCFCVVGANGTGKSTLVKTILGLVPPIEGEISLGAEMHPGKIGYLPQQKEMQRDFPATVKEVVMSGTLNRRGWRPYYSCEERARAGENMERMGIAHLSEKSYSKLSGGQQQRVLIARALCAAGQILLLDEPACGLDPETTCELYDLICALNQEGISIIMVSHDIPAVLKYATHVLHMGKSPLFIGTTEDYVNNYLSNEGGGDCAHN